MRYKKVCVESFGYEIPETVVSSRSLEERLAPIYQKLNLSYGRLELITGIRERRFWEDGITPSQASSIVAEQAIAKSGIDKGDIECILHTSVSRDFLEPATASVVHDSLGLPGTATVFDISNACLGFTNGMVTLANMIELGQVKAGIVVGSETSTLVVNATIDELLNDPRITRDKLKQGFASLTLGCGAAAVLLSHSSLSRCGHRLSGGVVRTASQHNDLCRIEPDTFYHDPSIHPNMSTDFAGILNNGLLLSLETWKAFQREVGWTESQVDRFFTHEVSSTFQEALFHTLGLDESKRFSTVEYLGNIGSCSLPVSLAIAIGQGHVDAGDRVVMMAAGSGLCTVALGLEW